MRLVPALCVVLVVLATTWNRSAYAEPLTTAFTYQGVLKQNGQPVTGPVNLTFYLYDALSGGTQVGSAVFVTNQSLENGTFTTVLNTAGEFGPNAFDGQRRWLAISVNGAAPLSPRQEVTASPNAQFALRTPWSGLIGVPSVALLDAVQTFTARPVFSAGLTASAITLTAGPQAGHVLTSDVNGNGTWQPPPTVVVPVASIVAWHGSMPGAPSLPTGWLPCNGQTVSDPSSPLNGQALPNLNGEGRFLRGASVSGVLQDDEFKSHTHGPGTGGSFLNVTPGGGTMTIPQGGGGAFPLASTTAATGGTETRPINMSVIWIIRIK